MQLEEPQLQQHQHDGEGARDGPATLHRVPNQLGRHAKEAGAPSRGQAEPEGCGGVLPEPYTYTVLCVTLGS